MTAGSMAKTLIKPVLQGPEGDLVVLLPVILVMTTILTTLIMIRFLFLLHYRPAVDAVPGRKLALPWLMLSAVVLLFPFFTGYKFPPITDNWPVLAGIVIAIITIRTRPAFLYALPGRIPPGDMIELFRWLYRPVHRYFLAILGLMERPVNFRKHPDSN